MRKKSFDQIIEELNIPSDFKPYELQVGKFRIADHLLPHFRKLFRPSGQLKSTGNGEVALYWLLSNKHGGKYEVSKNRGYTLPDLNVGDKKVEVKAWPHAIDGPALKIGRCESNHRIRKVINTVMGVYNVFGVGSYNEKHGEEAYLSEISFGMNGLTRAFDCALSLYKSGKVVTKELEKAFQTEEFINLEDPADYAAKTFAMLAATKLVVKPGEGNFIVNVRPDNMGEVEIFKIGKMDAVDLDIIKDSGAVMDSSMLKVKILAFKGSDDD